MSGRGSLSAVAISAAMLAAACLLLSAEQAVAQFLSSGSMGGMQPPPPPPAEVARRLEHSNVSVRLRGLDEAERIGPPAAEILPAIHRALDDPNREIRLRAADRLEVLAESDPRIVEVYVDALHTGTRENLLRVAAPLIRHAPQRTGQIVDGLIEIVDGKDRAMRLAAMHIVSQIGPPAKAAVPALVRASESNDEQICRSAITAIGRAGPNAARATLLAALKSDMPYVRDDAATALLACDPITPEIGRALLDGLRIPESEPPYSTVIALMPTVAGVVPDTAEQLTAMLSSPCAAVQIRGAEGLAALHAGSRPAVAALIDALQDADRGVRCAAARSLREARVNDTRTIEALIALSKDPDLWVRQTAVYALRPLVSESTQVARALIARLFDESRSLRGEALVGLGIGRVEALISDDSPATRGAVLAALAESHGFRQWKELIPSLRKRLALEPDPRLRSLVCLAASRAYAAHDGGSEKCDDAWIGKELLPAATALLADQNHEVRLRGVESLGTIGRSANAAVTALVKLLDDRDQGIRGRAVLALAQIGPAAQQAGPALAGALRDDDPRIRSWAAWGLQTIQAKGDEVLDAVVEAISAGEPQIRAPAARALATVGPAERVVPLLLIALRDPDEKVRGEAATTLGQRAAAADAQVVSAMVEALGDRSLRGPASAALVAIGRRSPLVANELARRVNNNEEAIFGSVVSIFRQLDASCPTAMLVRIVRTADDSRLAQSAADTLGQLGPDAAEVIAALGELGVRWSETEENHDQLVQILRDVGPAVVPALQRALVDRRAQYRQAAAWAVVELGPEAKEAFPILFRARNDPDAAARRAMIVAIGRVGGNVEGVLTELVDSLAAGPSGDADDDPYQHAIKMLRYIGQPAASALRRGLRDDDPHVRGGALDALVGSQVDMSVAVPEIILLLDDPDDELRWQSLLILDGVFERAGTLPGHAVTALRKMARDDPDEELRAEAARVIENLGGE